MPQRPRIGRRISESEPVPVGYPRPPAGAPNVVMIVLDDVGFAQLGCFGGEIDTPNIDRLAAGGLRYNRFHVTSICSSTRACLLTGRNHHAVGVGLTQESTLAFPGYTGRIPPSAATLARILRDTGYSTLAVGKWHLAARTEYSAAGPMDRWPLGLGFERYYGFLGAETSQWAPELVRDNSHIDPPRTAAEGYHLTEDLADQAIAMILDQQHAAPDKPFFCYFATGAAHAPHQVPRPWVDAYRGRFDGGWDRWRDQAFARQLATGVVPGGTDLPPRPSWVPAWESLSADERRLYARYMEVFAAFVTHTDAQIGRIIDFLARRSILDDTLVLVLSDNGASAEGEVTGNFDEGRAVMGMRPSLEEALARMDEFGGHRMAAIYPWGWAWAGNAPFRLFKRYAWLGGVRTPLIVHWPGHVRAFGAIRSQFCHAIDLFPTVLDVIGVDAPDVVDGVTQQPIDGTSLAATLTDADAPERHTLQYFEMHGSRGLYHQGWKVTTDHVSPLFREREVIEGSHDFDDDHWGLFHLDTDFAEAHDVSAEHPERVAAMRELWWAEAGRNQVLPLFEGMVSQGLAPQPGEFPPPARAVYEPGGGPIAGSHLPSMLGGFTITAELALPEHPPSEGIICALGDLHGGWAFYLLDGRPVAFFALLGGESRVAATDPLPPDVHTLSLTYAPGAGGGTIVVAADGEPVAEGATAGLMHVHSVITSGAGLLVGRDRGLAVCDDYQPPFPFSGVLHRVVMESTKPAARPDPRSAMRTAVRTD
jgi:arylsulfatase A-like enzyme